MEITVTVQEIVDKGVWDQFCMLKGINVWAINEGLIDYDECFRLDEIEAFNLGFLQKSRACELFPPPLEHDHWE